MNYIFRNLRFVAAACVTAMIGIATVTAIGQEAVTKEKGHFDGHAKNKGFCTNNNWSGNDRVSASDLREMTLPASGSIAVNGGQNGGISVKGEDRGDILVRACVQAWGRSEEEAKSLASAIRIGTNGTIKAESSGDDKNFSVSYQILAPRSTNLNLKAHNGGISIGNIDGTAEFETMNGGVNVSDSAGNFKGRTTNGGVNVRLAGNSWKGSGLDLQTTNGGVNVTMPVNYSAQIETGTVNGGFNTDIKGLEVEKPAEEKRYGNRATKINTALNGGGAPIRVVTTNGGVRFNTMERE